LIYIETPKKGRPIIRNVLFDFYDGKLDEEVARLLKRKEKVTSYEPLKMEVLK
jgi:hypothetical protein